MRNIAGAIAILGYRQKCSCHKHPGTTGSTALGSFILEKCPAARFIFQRDAGRKIGQVEVLNMQGVSRR
jgi:hypothetical protein